MSRSPHSFALASSLALALFASGSGCTSATLAAESAEPTHCPADQLTIDDARQPVDGPSSWTATCGADGQRWFCSRMHQRVICTEDPGTH